MKSELVPLNGGPPIPITRDVTVVGRREGCDVQIPHSSLSRRHCVLVRTDGLLMVRDLATTNGTRVNGQRVLWAALLPNDRLSLGGVKFRVYLGSDNAPSPSESQPRNTARSASIPALAEGGTTPPSIDLPPSANEIPTERAPAGRAGGRYEAVLIDDDDEEAVDLD